VLQFLHHQPQFVLNLIRHSIWLILLTIVFVPLEALFAVHPRRIISRSVPGDIGFYFISSFIPQLLLIAPLTVAAYVAYHFVPWRVHAAVAQWPLWLRGIAAFVVGDFGFYWGHRWVHRVPLLWRFHAVHHAPEEVYFLVGARGHPVDNMVIRLCGLVPIYLLGVGAPQSVQGTLVATLVMLLVTVWGYFIHANVRWRFGPLEWLVATPAFHHWHHVRSEVRDRNYASMLPVWDWLFGTAYLPQAWPEAYGIDEKLPDSVAGQLAYPLRGPADLSQLAPATRQ